jgi:D-alanyl-lipoteichoic acid acyltransferase DltB (MBOAT superfamily)
MLRNACAGVSPVLFDSLVFIFCFLPVTLAGFDLLGRHARGHVAWAFLVIASLVYYGFRDPAYVLLVLASAAFNYALSRRLGPGKPYGRALLAFGVISNLGVIGYYKYTNFAVEIVNGITGSGLQLAAIALPIGISFITFQKIAYLVDASRGKTRNDGPLEYLLFVTFFPQLLAGPIVHHSEMMPQFRKQLGSGIHLHDLTIGLTTFTIGLAKKVLIADQVARFANPVFDAAAAGQPLTFLDGWIAALSYTMQLYFDFSGYSDMAIGIAAMFGVRLPPNFDAPYRSRSIVEFWRRWHMTLSRFLRDYLYVPLGGNRHGRTRRYLNLMLTMILGGLWHGAGFTFIAWGALHGLYLCANHAWDAFASRALPRGFRDRRGWQVLGTGMTFIAVVVGWVLFRADDLGAAGTVLHAMAGGAGFEVTSMIGRREAILWLLACGAIVGTMPTTQQWMEARFAARPKWAFALLALSLICVANLSYGGTREFIYYQF